MFGKLFNTLSATINMEPTGPGAGPNFSGSSPAAFPSLSDFGLGSLAATVTRPQRPPQQQSMAQPPSAARPPAPPRASAPPDVDLTGLSEEEKAMIQSVMLRAQESDPAAAATATAGFQPLQQQPQVGLAAQPIRSQVPGTSIQQQRPQQQNIHQQQMQQNQQLQQLQQKQQQQMQQNQQQQQQQQLQSQQQQQQQLLSQQQAMAQGQALQQQQIPTSRTVASASQSQQQSDQFGRSFQQIQDQRPLLPQPQQQQQKQITQAQPQSSQQQQAQVQQSNQHQPSPSRMPATQENAMSQLYSQQMSSTTNDRQAQQQQLGHMPTKGLGQQQLGELGQKLDKQNFIETLQHEAQPTAISPAAGLPVAFPTQLTSSNSTFQSQVPGPFPMSNSSGMPVSMFPGSSMYSSEQATPAAHTSAAFPGSSALTSTSSAFSPSTCLVPATASTMVSYGQPLSSASSIASAPGSQQNQVFLSQHPSRKMVHQQSWSEGSFDNALQPTGASSGTAAVPGLPYPFNRRRSMEQIAGLPQDYGMNAVLEPLDVKIPPAAAANPPEAQSKADSMQFNEGIKSPPSEYSVSQACDVSQPLSPSVSLSCEVPSSTVHTKTPRDVVHVVDQIFESILSPPQVLPSIGASPATSCVAVDPVLPVLSDPVLRSDVLVVDPVLPRVGVDVPPAITEPSGSDEAVASVVPSRVVTRSPPEAWVNPFSQLLKGFDEDVRSDECSPPVVSCVSANNSSAPHHPECQPEMSVQPTPTSVCSPPVRADESRSSLTTDHTGTRSDYSPSRSSSGKSLATSDIRSNADVTPRRKGSTEDATGKADERRSSLGSMPTNFKARTGALLPPIPYQGKTVQSLRADRVCLRTGSLEEQEFVERLKGSDCGGQARQNSRSQLVNDFGGDSLNFEVDEDYEKEGEMADDDEDDDEAELLVGSERYMCDTIVEESEDESLSPRSVQKHAGGNKQQIQSVSSPHPQVKACNKTTATASSSTTAGPAARLIGGSREQTLGADDSKASMPQDLSSSSHQNQQLHSQQQSQQIQQQTQQLQLQQQTQLHQQQQLSQHQQQLQQHQQHQQIQLQQPLIVPPSTSPVSDSFRTQLDSVLQRQLTPATSLPYGAQVRPAFVPTPPSQLMNRAANPVPSASVQTAPFTYSAPGYGTPQQQDQMQTVSMSQPAPQQQQPVTLQSVSQQPASQQQHPQQYTQQHPSQFPGPLSYSRPSGPSAPNQASQYNYRPDQLSHQQPNQGYMPDPYFHPQQSYAGHGPPGVQGQRPPGQQMQQQIPTQQQPPPHNYHSQQQPRPPSHQSQYAGHDAYHPGNLMPPGKKMMSTAPQEYWMESDLSPIQDVSPSLEAAEQRSMEGMRRSVQTRQEMPVTEMSGMPRATSGTISGMIADFNKQMEALSTSSPTEEFNRSYREPSLRRTSSGPSPHHKQHQQGTSQSTRVKQSAGSQLLLKPDPVSIEKTVSPVIEHTLQQQQLLLQQQQALIELQKDQQQIQKALQDQLKLQTLQTQMQIEQQNKSQVAPAAKKADVATTGTSMSVPSTPKAESRDWCTDNKSHRDVRSPDRRDRNEAANRSTGDGRRSGRQQESSCRRSEYRDRTPERREGNRRREDSRSPDRNRDRDRSPDRRGERLSSKKDRRRLPQPTVEEMQEAISNSLPVSSLPRGGYRSETSPNFIKSKSPSAMTLRHQSAVMSSSPPIVAGSVQMSNITVLDPRSLSPGLLIASYPVQVVSPITRSYSPPIIETMSDSASDLWKKNRRLPLAPADEAAEFSKKLIPDKLFSKYGSGSLKPVLRPTSSLDSAPVNYATTRPTSCIPGRSSPHSALSDIAAILNSSSGLTSAPPLSTTLRAGKSSSGSLLDQLSRSSTRGPVLDVPGSRENSPSFLKTSPAYGYKTLKDQLKHELKMAVGERRSLLDDRDRDLHRRSENDLKALFDLYSNVPDVLLPSAGMNRTHRRNASDSALPQFSPTPEYLPPGYYKSHGYDTMSSYLDSDLQPRPFASTTELDFRSSAFADRLASSLLADYEDMNLHSRRRRSDGSIDLENLSYALDSYGRPVLCEYDMAERKFQRRKNPAKYSSMLPLDGDHLTREEKAARIRAEIARRREQMLNSELETGYAHSLEERNAYPENAGYLEDYEDNYDDMIDYEDDFCDARDPGDMRATRLRPAPAYLSRSLDTGFDDFAYDDYAYEEDAHGRPAQYGGFRERDVGQGGMFADAPVLRNQHLDDVDNGLSSSYPGRRGISESHYAGRASARTSFPRYPFPVKRILLTRDPKERIEQGNAYGMRIIGGKSIPNTNGMIGAFVAKILPGGVVDTLGEVREGNQVMEWNGVPLTGKTHDEVQAIIKSSMNAEEVELVVRADEMNPVHDPFYQAEQGYPSHQQQQQQQQQRQQQVQQQQHAMAMNHHQHQDMNAHANAIHHQQQQQQQQYHQMPQVQIDAPDDNRMAATKLERVYDVSHKSLTTAEPQLQICYDMKAAILYVTVIKAKNLRPVNGLPPDPFVKCYLLPPRVLDNQRRTRYFSRTTEPDWNQTMVYTRIQREDLPKKYLEISVWSFNIYAAHELLGQVIVHLSENFIMDDDAVWYPLGGEENVFRLNSELPHKRPPRCRILRSAYRSQRHGTTWPDTDVSSPATSSVTGFPACSPTIHFPGQTSNVKKFKFNFTEKIQRAVDGGKTTGTSLFKQRTPLTRSNLIFAFHDPNKKIRT